jgi:hypothetical protein
MTVHELQVRLEVGRSREGLKCYPKHGRVPGDPSPCICHVAELFQVGARILHPRVGKSARDLVSLVSLDRCTLFVHADGRRTLLHGTLPPRFPHQPCRRKRRKRAGTAQSISLSLAPPPTPFPALRSPTFLWLHGTFTTVSRFVLGS